MFTVKKKRNLDIIENKFEKKRKTTVYSNENDEEVYYELIKTPEYLNQYIFKDNELLSTLKNYYSSKLIKIDKIGEILINNKNKYNQGMYDKKHEHNMLTHNLEKIREQVNLEKKEFIKFYQTFKSNYKFNYKISNKY